MISYIAQTIKSEMFLLKMTRSGKTDRKEKYFSKLLNVEYPMAADQPLAQDNLQQSRL
jgi:hypothetical protein